MGGGGGVTGDKERGSTRETRERRRRLFKEGFVLKQNSICSVI